jgi:uncharacterized protein (DUF433 family)
MTDITQDQKSSRAFRSVRTRIQLDLPAEQVRLLDQLGQNLAVRSRADLIQEAIGALLWIVRENRSGRRVVSVNPEEITKLSHVVELASPALSLSADGGYEYLVVRPHPWRRQLYLKGRNLTVGQLVAKMNANKLTTEEAADDFDLPLPQVREALAYYETHRELVDQEFQEERRLLEARGYDVGPSALP